MIADKILLLVCDSLRYDHWNMGFNGRFGPSVRNWYAVSHCSDPNFASIYSGMLPAEHGVYLQVDRGVTLPRTIAEMAQATGLPTATLVIQHTARFYSQGFDTVWASSNAKATHPFLPELQQFMEDRSEYFVAVRLMESHEPYTGSPRRGKLEVRYKRGVDSALDICSRLVDAAKPGTLIIITADHGEGLGDHKPLGHICGLYDELIHVPFWCSRMFNWKARAYQHNAIYDLICRGWTNDAGWPLDFCGIGANGGELRWFAAKRTDAVKVVQMIGSDGLEQISVFDLQNDPAERFDLATNFPERPENPKFADRATLRRLKKLGYM